MTRGRGYSIGRVPSVSTAGKRGPPVGLKPLLSVAVLFTVFLAAFQFPTAVHADPPAPGLPPWSDALVAPDIPSDASTFHHSHIVPGYFDTSEYMLGSVAVAIIIPESNGAIDPNLENWTPEEEEGVIASVQRALDWWGRQEPAAHLSFTTQVYRKVPTSYEPVTHPNHQPGVPAERKAEQLWVNEVMANLGYSQGPHMRRVRDFVNDLRNRKGTDWAFAIFILDGSPRTRTVFPQSRAVAYAYLGGPFLAAIDEPGSWGAQNLDFVVAHEIAHIFYATDADDGEVEFSGYLNAPDDEGMVSLMGGSKLVWTLSPGTKLQIGWRDSNGDGIMDILDTTPAVSLQPHPSPTDASSLAYTGEVEEVPYPNRNPFGSRRSVTINTIKEVRYRVDGGAWRDAQPADGAFNSAEEKFSFTTPDLPVGQHPVEAVAANNLGHASPSPARDAPLVTFVVVDRDRTSTERANVGSTQQVAFHAQWAHDGSPVSAGTLSLNGRPYSLAGDGWATASASSQRVGAEEWAVTGVQAGPIQRFRQDAKNVSIIWDRVKVTALEVERGRVNVGEPVTLAARGVLEYDGAPLGPGDRLWVNGTPLTYDPAAEAFTLTDRREEVGRATFRVTGAEETRFGITALVNSAQSREVVWDKVEVVLEAEHPRVEVGGNAPLRVEGRYAYDGTAFPGDIALDHDLVGASVGKVAYTVAAISDPRYGLTAFSATTAVVAFDRLVPTVRTRSLLPGQATVLVTLRYASDASPVEGAAVALAGVEAAEEEAGSYVLRLSTWRPFLGLSLRVEQSGFSPVSTPVITPVWGNLTLTACLIFLLAAGGFLSFRRRPGRH
ncbi:MAG: hypothetical protein HY686_09155 [Chloroflexi bacterium]|nr:hypothetical protein [Chloroflexota bacterium]